MRHTLGSHLRRLIRDECGQMLPVMGFVMTAFLGVAGLSIDLGRAFVDARELQASTDAAAMAGAQSLPASTATTVATNFSSLTGDLNANNNLSNVTMVSGYPKLLCLTTLKNLGEACVAPSSANAVRVQQQATVNMYFASLFGKKSITLTATSTASMRGASSTPYNVAIIVDTTASMSDSDSSSQCKSTRLSCALAGVLVLLQDLDPCASSEASCGSVTNGMVSNSVDRVALFTFPNVTPATVGADYDCSGSTNPITEPYTFPSTTASSYTPVGSPTGTYQIVPFSSDFRVSDTATSLSTSSDVVLSVGGKSGCTGVQDPGGQGTYYAGAIYAAQSALLAEQALYPGSQNVIVLVSDGDASATKTQMDSAATGGGTYPSYNDQCAQAVTAAQSATAAGTHVYTVAYGAESSGCSTDSPNITPCQVMEEIASAPQYFFSDYGQSGSGIDTSCVSSAQPTSNLNQIFTQIAGDLTVARLIPNNTT
jgi:Flp pilus assembly protein TadG